jgi:hypothetical protein
MIMPEIAVQRLIQYGIKELKKDKESFEDIFCFLSMDPFMKDEYGPAFVETIWTFFTEEKLRVVQGWSLNMQTVPCYSVTLASDVEDESKAAIGDFYGDAEDYELMVSPSTVMLDIGCHASKSSDQVLWLYYILAYILLKHKRIAESMGIELQTQSASDWARENNKIPENLFTRWVRMRVTVYNTWIGDRFSGPYNLDVELSVERLKNGEEQFEVEEL